MTEGHKHRTVRIHKDDFLLKILTKPLPFGKKNYAQLAKVEASPYPYRTYINGSWVADKNLPTEPGKNEEYRLTMLALLHRWFGLVLDVHKE